MSAVIMCLKYFILCRILSILWDIVNPQLGSGLGLGLSLGLGSGLGLGLGLDSVRGSTISHKMKYLPEEPLSLKTALIVILRNGTELTLSSLERI